MSELRREIWENGIRYTLIGDYCFPDVRSPEDCDSFGRWADLHLAYVVSLDEFDMSRNGIKHRNIRDFLPEEEWM